MKKILIILAISCTQPKEKYPQKATIQTFGYDVTPVLFTDTAFKTKHNPYTAVTAAATVVVLDRYLTTQKLLYKIAFGPDTGWIDGTYVTINH